MGLTGIVKGVQRKPRRVLLYGTHGIGKSTWAAQAPKPIFLATEDGLDNLDCERTPPIKSFGNFNEWCSKLLQDEHDYRTVVIDSLDWLERLIHDFVALSQGKKSIDDIPYGKGYAMAVAQWDFVLKTLDHLRNSRGMAVIALAHARIVKVSEPESDSYDRYEPDLHKAASPMLQEWADEVLFARYRVLTKKEDLGFNRTRTIALDTEERIVWTCERPTHLAKRRAKMPDTLPLDFGIYAQYLRGNGAETQSAGDIAGIVNNGSSKQPQQETVTNG